MLFTDAELSRDAFLGGALILLQPRKGYRAAIDPVLLAAAVPATAGERALDLGCGAGTAAFCLARRVPGVSLTGLELQPDYADLARRNGALNGIEMTVIEGNIARLPDELRGASFEHVLINPPFFGPGTPASDRGREAALRARAPLRCWIDTATRRLKPGGSLTGILAAERLPELLQALDTRLASLRIQPLAARAGRDASRILFIARKGGHGGFRLHAPLILHQGREHDTDRDSYRPEIRRILRDGAGLDFGQIALK